MGTAIGAGVGALATGAAGKAIGGFAGKVVTGSRKIVTKGKILNSNLGVPIKLYLVGREAHLLPKKDSEKTGPNNQRPTNHAAIEAPSAPNVNQPHRAAPPVPATAPPLAGAPPPYEAYADPNAAPPPYSYTVTTTISPSAPPSAPPQHGPPQPAPRSNNLYPSLN